jgi:arsenate reductase
MKPLILILCTGNSCRSHMAEGILRHMIGERYRIASAGHKPSRYVHPLAVMAMLEIGIDITSHRSKHLHEFLSESVETVITVCGKADEACPMFPGQVNRHHFPFDDPARATGNEDQQLIVFRRVRDQIVTVFTAYAVGRGDEAKQVALWHSESRIGSSHLGELSLAVG